MQRLARRLGGISIALAIAAAAFAGDKPGADPGSGPRHVMQGDDHTFHVAESPDGAWLALAGEKSVQAFPQGGGKPRTIATKDTWFLAFTQDSQWLVTVANVPGAPEGRSGYERVARAWSFADPSKRRELPLELDAKKQPRIVERILPLGGARVAIVQWGRSAIWDLSTGKQDGLLPMGEKDTDYATSADGVFAAVVSFPDVELRDAAGKTLWRADAKRSGEVSSYGDPVFSRDGSIVALNANLSSGEEGRIEGHATADGKALWDLRTTGLDALIRYPCATRDGFAILREWKVRFLGLDGKEQAYVGCPSGAKVFDIYPTADGIGVWASEVKTGAVVRIVPPTVTGK